MIFQESFQKIILKKFRFFIGDIRDKSRLTYALKDVDIVVMLQLLNKYQLHNPFEFVKTNILGAQNVIEASLDTNVKMFLLCQLTKQVHL